jgi:group I intron endonuclease
MTWTYGGVYKIENTLTGDFYIGSSVNLNKRLTTHKNKLSRGCHDNLHLQNSWCKYGESNFKFAPLIICDEENLLMYEQLFIDNLVPTYNKRIIATSNIGIRLQDSTKEKIRLANIGRKHSDETKQKCAIASAKSRKNIKTHHITLLSPDGIIYKDIFNMAKFCREHDLKGKHMWNLTSRTVPTYKGWKLLPEESAI